LGLADFASQIGARSQAGRSAAREAPIAIVDIGSNSVRLVIYQSLKRSAQALHNEKSICAIGRNMVSTGALDEHGIDQALAVLARFRQLCAGHGVSDCMAVATAAARDASNGPAFIAQAGQALGYPITVLSGEDEARIAAEGVLAGIPMADGLVADLGGGSLDMVMVRDGVTSEAATLPFGPLRLMDSANGHLDRARNIVNRGLDTLPFAGQLKNRALYAVGGIWRTFARLDIEQQNYPLHVLHHYVIPANRALKLCKVVSGLSRKSLEKIPSVPRRRAEALPYGALVLEGLIQRGDLREVVISAYGLREGVMQRALPPAEAAKDPLVDYAMRANAHEARTPDHAGEMVRWMAPLFAAETPAQRRVREAACYFSDSGWRRHPDDRASGTFAEILRAPYAGADHRERAILATAIYYRYAGGDALPENSDMAGLLGAEGAVLALRIGLAARLAFALTGSVAGELPSTALKLTDRALILELPAARRALLGETVTKRLGDLADAFGRKPDTVIV
jgi:exopolyphosphatase/guanosine-5'-triphosphate,3'-diphosphate pyrophosphatase